MLQHAGKKGHIASQHKSKDIPQMRAAHSTMGDDIQYDDDMIVEREEVEVDSAESTKEAVSDRDGQASEGNDKSKAAWDEIKYKVYGNFQDSDGYGSLEHMDTMREADKDTEGSSDDERGHHCI